MKKSVLTVVFWNVWYYTQDGKRDDGSKLISRLGKLVDEHKPDILGLNEVLASQHDNSSAVIDFLKSRGYFCHFALISPTGDKWFVGNLLATKSRPEKISEHLLGPDTQAARRGFAGYDVSSIEAELNVNGVAVTIVLNYLCSLFPADWGTHITHRKNYEKAVGSIENKNLIIGGDFNETKYMLPWFRLPKHLKRKTGGLHNPTWRLNGQKRYLAFANYDNLIYSAAGQLHLKQFAVLKRQPSDHAPLLGIFSLHR